VRENFVNTSNCRVKLDLTMLDKLRVAASSRVIELGPGSRPAKTRFGSGFWYRVFGPNHDVDIEYSSRITMLISSIDPNSRFDPLRHEVI